MTHIQESQLSHKGVSKVSEQAHEWRKAERCGASEQCERTNVASDRVARSKRDRL